MTTGALSIQKLGMDGLSKKEGKGKQEDMGFDSIMNRTASSKQNSRSSSKSKNSLYETTDSSVKNNKLYHQAPHKKANNSVSEDTAGLSKDQAEAITSKKDLENTMVNEISDILDISEEELEKLLEELGIPIIDLLNADTLKQLVVKVNDGVDATELLTNELMMSQLDQMVEVLNRLKSDPNIKELLAHWEENLSDVTSELVSNKDGPQENSGQDMLSGMGDSKPDGIKITVETNDGAGSQMKQESQVRESRSADVKEQPTGVVDMFVQQLAKAGNQDSSVQMERVEQMREIVKQVVEQVKITVNADTSKMELQLNPESLGKVNLSIVVKEGVAIANFMVQNETVKEALQSQIQVLRENLEQQGLKVATIEVNVSEFGFEQSNQSKSETQKNSHRTRKNLLEGLDEDSGELEEATSAAIHQEVNGNSVDFTA